MLAVVRPVPDSYADATVSFFGAGSAAIDVTLAREQHAAYVAALRSCGLRTVGVPVAHELPDSVFVEDTAVVRDGKALVACSAHPVRRREAPAVEAVLEQLDLDVVRMEAPGLDGGDVLQVGGEILVARSERTDASGVAALKRVFGHVVREVPMPSDTLHLKCVCSAPAPDVLVAVEGLDLGVDARVVRIPTVESYAANTVGAAGRVLVAAGYPRTAEALARVLEPVVLDTTEFHKGDGSLTCLSILVTR